MGKSVAGKDQHKVRQKTYKRVAIKYLLGKRPNWQLGEVYALELYPLTAEGTTVAATAVVPVAYKHLKRLHDAKVAARAATTPLKHPTPRLHELVPQAAKCVLKCLL